MKKILFVCTGNIFRSRFAEEVFNNLCIINDVDASAFSAGLQVGRYKQRKIYWPAMNELERLKIEPLRPDEDSVHINDTDVVFTIISFAWMKRSINPMVRSNKLLSGFNFKYWNIVDMPKVSSDISLPNVIKK